MAGQDPLLAELSRDAIIRGTEQERHGRGGDGGEAPTPTPAAGGAGNAEHARKRAQPVADSPEETTRRRGRAKHAKAPREAAPPMGSDREKRLEDAVKRLESRVAKAEGECARLEGRVRSIEAGQTKAAGIDIRMLPPLSRNHTWLDYGIALSIGIGAGTLVAGVIFTVYLLFWR